MDWSRSKSIFIFVFLILNIFLYSQYINRYEEGQNVQMQGDKSIEAKLKEDNITYDELPSNIESVSVISGKVHNFSNDELNSNPNAFVTVKDQYILISTFREPYRLPAINKESLEQFVKANVIEGQSYTFWSINEANHTAIFFQRVKDRTLYYNDKGYVKVYWDEQGNIFTYEQALFEKFEEYEQKEDIMTPIQVIQILYNRNLLASNAHVKHIELGYATLVQLTQTQVFTPTWEVEVEIEDEQKNKQIEKFYLNATDGKVIDMDMSMNKEDIVEDE